MKRRLARSVCALVVLGLVGFASSTLESAAAAEPTRPNVLLILTDDQRQGADAMSVMPQAQSYFGGGGTEFTNFFVSTPLCGPSRASLMSGRYAHNHEITCNGPPELVETFDENATLQRHLRSNGYKTALVGKYLNYWPLNRRPLNFDRVAMFGSAYVDPLANVDGSLAKRTGYSTDLMADYAVQFLRDFNRNADDRPWFLVVSVTAPHPPYTPAPRHRDAAVPTWQPSPASLEQDVSDKFPLLRSQPYDLSSATTVRRQQLRSLMAVDELVGKVTAELNALGEQNAVSILTSDNGYSWNDHHVYATKRVPYDPATRVPFFLRRPGTADDAKRDTRLALNVDIFPTVLQATGVGPATFAHPLDGYSLLGTRQRQRMVLEYWKSTVAEGTQFEQDLGTWASTRTKTYQYVEFYGDDGTTVTFREYYNLVADPYQLTNLYGDSNPSNGPDPGPLHTVLIGDRTCVGTTCP